MDSPHLVGSSSSPAPSFDHTHHSHFHHSLLHPISNLPFGDEDSTPQYHDTNSSFCGQYDALVGRFVDHVPDVEDPSLDLDLDPETGSADSSSYDIHHQSASSSYGMSAALHHHSQSQQHYQHAHLAAPHHHTQQHQVYAPVAQYHQHSYADQWLQQDDEPTVSSPGSDAHEWDTAYYQQQQAQTLQYQQQYTAPAPAPAAAAVSRPANKRSASDAGMTSHLEYNPKRVKVESAPQQQPVQPAAVLDTNNLVAAYQQLLLMQLQQVQALMGSSPAGSTAPHSPSGVSSSASSAPPSPIKPEPTSPASAHSNQSSPSTPVESTRDPTYHAPHRERRVRPKVVPEKGGVQCQGFNRKKNVRCRNAALMEYMGPRPSYCAEHIHLDPECLYTKCQSTYHSSPEDGKGCREVVLKEFGFCHKHFEQFTAPLTGADGLAKTNDCLQRVEDCLARLTVEAQSAKKVDPDLFQRKHKLIPKFVQMKTCLTRHVHFLSAAAMRPQTEAPLMATYAPVASYYQPTTTTH